MVPTVEYAALIEKEARAVWSVLGHFEDVQTWHPSVARSVVEESSSEAFPGQVRTLTVTVRPSHLPNPCIKDDGVRVFLSGRDHPHRKDFHAPTKLLSETVQGQVVQECLQPGATVSSVAISHGINANVIRKWMPIYRDQPATSLPAFVPLTAAPKRPYNSLISTLDQMKSPYRA